MALYSRPENIDEIEVEQGLSVKKNKNSLDYMPVKIHNTMARTIARFESPEHAKLFLIAVGSLLNSTDHIAHISKVELFDKLGVDESYTDRHTQYFRMFKKMAEKTSYDITIDEDTQIAGNIIYRVKRTRGEYQIAFDDEMAPIIKELKEHYTLMYVDAVLSLSSSHSITLYNYLMSWFNPKYIVNKRWLTTKDLKELLGLDENSYMRKNNTFDRNNFEKYCIQKAIDEIAKAGYMNIRWYKAKDRLTHKVIAYVFEFVVQKGFNDEEKESGICFTEFKYGKGEDVIISNDDELRSTSKVNEDNIVQTSIDDFI